MKGKINFEFLINFIMVVLLGLMGIFVFTNVVLRYVFNSGLVWAEEMSRFLYVWLVFIGAIGALKDNNHLGFSSLVQRMPLLLKKICFIISNLLVLGCLWILLDGSIDMTLTTLETLAPATEVPLAYMYFAGVLSSACMFLIVCYNLYKGIFVKGAIDKLVILKESEEEVHLVDDAEGGKAI